MHLHVKRPEDRRIQVGLRHWIWSEVMETAQARQRSHTSIAAREGYMRARKVPQL